MTANDSHDWQGTNPMARSISYCIKELPGGGASSWTWDVKVDGRVVTRGIATTMTSARVSAIRAARSEQIYPAVGRRDAGVGVF
jgi:hypothetical protein